MSRKKTTDYLNGPYSRILIPNEDGTFSAEIMEFPGCFAEGASREEALENLEAAADAWIQSALRQETEIAEPFSVRGFSGAISLRLPRGLHKQAARMAEREGTSLNQYIVTAIAARVGADDLVRRMATNAVRSVVLNLTHNESVTVLSLPATLYGSVPAGEVIRLNLEGSTYVTSNTQPMKRVGAING